MTPNLDQLAAATFAALNRLPDFVHVAHELRAAPDRASQDAILRSVDDETGNAALRYLATDEGTRERERKMEWMREDARRVTALRHYFAQHVPDFINTFGFSTDPRLIAKGKHALIPLRLWPRQIELLEWMLERWKRGEPGTVKKSRDIGATVLSVSLLASLAIFHKNFVGGIASSTEAKLDGPPDTVFGKLRMFLKWLPPEFSAGYNPDKHANYLRILFPESGSSIVGHVGDQAGRGSRTSLFIVDESAWFEHPKMIDASLAATTDCRIDCSSVNGLNAFYERCHTPEIPLFEFHWRSDPRKDDAWYAQKVATLDPVVVAQEIDMNFTASVEGVIIPSAWVQAAIDLHLKLDIKPTGDKFAGLDVADRGQDKNAMAFRHGILLDHVESWSGKESDIYATAARAFRLCDERGFKGFDFDEDGLGAGVRGDARVLNDSRKPHQKLLVVPYRGSASPLFPNQLVPRTNRTNADFHANRKAQNWLHLAARFNESWKASKGEPYDPEMIISINSKMPELTRLIAELSQATRKESVNGKLAVEKTPDGALSPNLADAVCIAFGVRNRGLQIPAGTADRMEGAAAARAPIVSVDSGFSDWGMVTPVSSWPAAGSVYK